VYKTCQRDKNQPVEEIDPFKVRIAQPKDLKGLVEVLSRSFYLSQPTVPGLQPLFKLGMTEDMRGRLRSGKPNYRCLVACQGETIVGTVELGLRNQMMAKQIPYISNLAVIPEYRRKGIARKLLLKCEQISWEWGFEELSLHVLDNNLAGQQLYLKNGYKLQKIEYSLSSWLFHQPKRLLMFKRIEV
jgi:ribosomal protein S18 acetylase RimI-like enzyme